MFCGFMISQMGETVDNEKSSEGREREFTEEREKDGNLMERSWS